MTSYTGKTIGTENGCIFIARDWELTNFRHEEILGVMRLLYILMVLLLLLLSHFSHVRLHVIP